MKQRWVWDGIVLGASLSAYSALSLYQLDLPGLYYDEALDAVPAMQLLLGQPVELLRQTGLSVGGWVLPLMVMEYVGPVNTYAVLPFFALLGIHPASLRLMTVAGGAVTVVLTYLFAKALFPRPVAALATLLLAVHPSFIFYVRQGVHVTSLMTVMAMGTLWALERWRQGGHWAYLVLAAFLLGIGLSAKILFLWFILALLLLIVLQYWRSQRSAAHTLPSTTGAGVLFRALTTAEGEAGRARQPRSTIVASQTATPEGKPPSRRLTWPLSIVMVLAFLGGSWPLLLYNLKTQGTLSVVAQNFLVSQYGIHNLDIIPNLLVRLDTFKALLHGGHFWFLGGTFSNPLYPPLFGVAWAAALLLPLWNRRLRPYWYGTLELTLLVLLILFLSGFTISGIWPTHLFLLLPLVTVLLALGVYVVAFSLPLRPLAFAIGGGVALLLLGSSVVVDVQYHRALQQTGGRRAHSDAIYRLASYLQERNVAEPIAMDWGIKPSLQLLTQGRVNPVEIFQYTPEPNETFFHWLYGALTKGERLYLFHAEDAAIFPRYEAFRAFAAKWEKQVTQEQVVRERDGTPLYMVYSAR